MDRLSMVIRSAMARAAFLCSWADRAEERGVSLSGKEIEDVAPRKTSKEANAWAKYLAKALSDTNENAPLTKIYEGAMIFYGYTESPERFGHELAMEAMGHGISWTDNLPLGVFVRGNAINLIHLEFYGENGR